MDRDSLIKLIRSRSRALAVQPETHAGDISRITGIRAVLFDIYGTLLMSDAGTGEEAEPDSSHLKAIQSTLETMGMGIVSEENARLILSDYQDEILKLHREAHLDGVEYPEVEIRDVWGAVIGRAAHAGIIDGRRGRADIERFTIEYECRANPFWPMPGALEVLKELRHSGLVMGIVSNAQFYTPLAIEALLGNSPESLGFTAPYCAFSFEFGRAKPGEYLFVRVLENLAKEGISPAQALYVGNDMLKDIWPASRLGMKTCLFAGDKKTLRLRQSDPRCEELRPDAVITRMTELLKVVGI